MHEIDLQKLDLSSLTGDEYVRVLSWCESVPQTMRQHGYIVVAPAVAADSIRMHRTEVGTAPRSVVGVLGLFDHVIDYIIRNLKPRCAQCECDAVEPKTLESYRVPTTGVIALSVVDSDSDVPLRERVELLGVERAYVDGYLVSATDLLHQKGEPVLCATAAPAIQQVKETADHWFARGGKELRVLHYSSRTSEGSELGTIYNSWSCPHCRRLLPTVSRARALDAPKCTTCRGEGWILAGGRDDGQRWLACRECDGLGFCADFSGYNFHGVKLSQSLVFSFAELRDLVAQESPGDEIVPLLSEVCTAGLGPYPLGTVYDLCSPGERMLIAVAQLRLARLEADGCLLDGAYGDLSGLSSTSSSGHALSVTRLGVRPGRASLPRLEVAHDAQRIVIRDVHHGPLCIDEVTFPRGTVTAICGPVGSGKSLLLSILSKRFSQRRKRAHVASFGNMQRCWFADGLCDSKGALLSVLDLEKDLANEIAGTRRAKELGILADDLQLPRSKYRCEECLGGEIFRVGEVCATCQGALYDWRVAELPLLGATVGEIVRAPMSQVVAKPWSDSGAEAVFGVLADLGVDELSLGAQAIEISLALRRTLKIAALLARVGSSGPPQKSRARSTDLTNHLVLLDGPRVLPGKYEEIIGRLLHGLSQRGATILYVSIPEGLESCCQSVLRLEWCARDLRAQAASSYLDQRFARESRVVA